MIPVRRWPVVRALPAIAVLALAAELVVRTWLASPSQAIPDPAFGFVMPPHVLVVHSTEGYSRQRTNALGQFDDELRVPPPPLRALLLGDSYAEALQVPRRLDFCSVAESLEPGVEVVNAGLSGRSPLDYAATLEGLIPSVHPNAVVVVVNDGDLDDIVKRLRPDGSIKPPESRAGPLSLPARLARAVLRTSALAQMLRNRVEELTMHETARLRHKFEGRPLYLPTAPIDPRVAGVLDRVQSRLAATGMPIIYVYIPGMTYFDGPPHVSYPDRRRFYHEFAARNGVTLVDVADDFVASVETTGQPVHGFPNSLIGKGHINARGHGVVGRDLAAALGKLRR